MYLRRNLSDSLVYIELFDDAVILKDSCRSTTFTIKEAENILKFLQDNLPNNKENKKVYREVSYVLTSGLRVVVYPNFRCTILEDDNVVELRAQDMKELHYILEREIVTHEDSGN